MNSASKRRKVTKFTRKTHFRSAPSKHTHTLWRHSKHFTWKWNVSLHRSIVSMPYLKFFLVIVFSFRVLFHRRAVLWLFPLVRNFSSSPSLFLSLSSIRLFFVLMVDLDITSKWENICGATHGKKNRYADFVFTIHKSHGAPTNANERKRKRAKTC